MKAVTDTPPKLVVFSDLDGTLLDHETYSWEPARPTLTRMKALGIPLILASSKTASEIAALRADMGFSHCPAIVENGAGLLPAGAEVVEDGGDYQRIRAALDQLPTELRAPFEGFGDMDAERICAVTGLSLEAAKAAADRAFSEPGVWASDSKTRETFIACLGDLGIKARSGGRFLTLSFGATKADRMDEICGAFEPKPASLALGDAPNDVEMVEGADYGVVVANPHGVGIGPLRGEEGGRIRRTKEIGPTGWNAEVSAIIDAVYGKEQ